MSSLDASSTGTMTTEEEALLLATHHGVQQLSETSRGAWLKSKIKYADEHPFVVPQADVKEGTNELAGGTSRCHSPVKNRRAVFRHLEKIRTRSPPAVPQENTSPVQEKSPSEDTDNVASITVSQSPEIVLSPAPINQSKSQKHSLRGPRSKPGLVKNKNNLSVDIPSATPAKIIVTAASPTTPLNSITLVPPRTISPRAEIDSADPELDDTHADALTRLLFVLLRHPAHPPPYIPEITVELASVLYALYATDGDVDALGEEGQWSMNDYAESDAYWCVRALMGEVALAGSLVPGNQLLEKLAKRVFWADDTLYRLLITLHLDPAKDAFAHEWLIHMLVRTIHPLSQLLPIWDAVIAENEDLAMLPQGTSSKMELLVDVCTAMLLLVKDSLKTINEAHRDNVRDPRRGFWMDADNDRLLFDENVPDLPADGNEEKTILAREMLRAYPIEAVEVNEVLRVMWEIRQRRIMALLDGEDLEAIVLPAAKLTERPDTEGFASKLGSLAIKAGSSVKETINPLPRYTTAAPIVNISSMKNSLVSGGERLKDYADTLQKSDTAAQVSKVSSNLTAVALMKLNDLAVASAKEAEGKSAWSIGAATKLWTRNRNMESDVIASPSRDKVQVADSASSSLPTIENGVSSEIESDTSIQNAPTSLFRRDTNLPPSFITPRGSIIYPAGRYRPKASNVGQGKPSLQSRLAAVASTPANMSTTTVSPERSAVRPLILSKSAKPASPLYGLPDPGKSSATSTNISPSPSLQNLDIENYVPRRVSISRRSQRSSLGGGSERDDSAGVDSVHSTSARLRKATRDSYGTASDNRRYRLSDPGAADDAKAKQSAAATSSQADAERYQLRDEVSPPSDNDTSAAGSRRESLDDAALAAGAGGVTRSKVVRKGKFASKPAHFRLQSAGHIDLDSDGVKPTSPAISDREVQTTLSNGDLNGHSIRPADTVPLTSETSQATTPKSLILPERPERSSSLLNRQHNPLVVRPTVDVQHLDVVRDAEEDEPLSAKDGYGDLLESYAAALESL